MIGMLLKIDPKPECLYATVTGHFSLEEATKTFLELLDAVAQHKSEKVLFDGREISGEVTAYQRFYYGDYVAGAVLALVDRSGMKPPDFAYVLKEPILDAGRFGELVAVNRGMRVKAFDNLEDALEWLGLRPSKLIP